jgi:hypothetical protein
MKYTNYQEITASLNKKINILGKKAQTLDRLICGEAPECNKFIIILS